MLRKRSQTAEKHRENKEDAQDYGPDNDKRWNCSKGPLDHENYHAAKRHVEVNDTNSLWGLQRIL